MLPVCMHISMDKEILYSQQKTYFPNHSVPWLILIYQITFHGFWALSISTVLLLIIYLLCSHSCHTEEIITKNLIDSWFFIQRLLSFVIKILYMTFGAYSPSLPQRIKIRFIALTLDAFFRLAPILPPFYHVSVASPFICFVREP